ncbi:hypothetical protein [Janthinobacterium sp. Ant5-2-1]|uniref:hypothetical protein n=1 Tax=Janthinobacterium sp. Ant5-2-1 TaxID=1755239 RepID=UPI001F3EA97C|nr:hypothetical protein [Janthinobacterium sp. Ant5-2-1]
MKIAISLLILSCLCTSALAQLQSLQHKKGKRRYIVYTPPRLRQRAAASLSRRLQFPWRRHEHGGTNAVHADEQDG